MLHKTLKDSLLIIISCNRSKKPDLHLPWFQAIKYFETGMGNPADLQMLDSQLAPASMASDTGVVAGNTWEGHRLFIPALKVCTSTLNWAQKWTSSQCSH